MTPDEILKRCAFDTGPCMDCANEAIEAAALVEREACAKIADDHVKGSWCLTCSRPEEIAAFIRARGVKP